MLCVNESLVAVFVAMYGLFKALQFNLTAESADIRSNLKGKKNQSPPAKKNGSQNKAYYLVLWYLILELSPKNTYSFRGKEERRTY